jgi:hypothetical protein
MARLRVHGFSISVDGYGAGPRQGLDDPLGAGGLELHKWLLDTPTFRQTHGRRAPSVHKRHRCRRYRSNTTIAQCARRAGSWGQSCCLIRFVRS